MRTSSLGFAFVLFTGLTACGGNDTGGGGGGGDDVQMMPDANNTVDPPPPAGGGAGPAPVPPVANPPVTPKPKPLKCKRGFKKKIVKGKPRCVKKKKKHKHHRHR